MADAVSPPQARPSWNPFVLDGTPLTPALLLMVKLLVIGLWMKGYAKGLPEPFLPFVEVLDALPERGFRKTLQLLFVVFGVALLFNRRVRTCCLVLGAVFLLGTLASRVYYRNAKVFVGLLFLMTGLQEPGRRPWLIHAQIALVYLGAGINKLLEPDWRTGQYFDHGLGTLAQMPVYLTVQAWFPPRVVARALSWWVIGAELLGGGMLLFRRTRAVGLWLVLTVHVGAMLLVAGDYGIFLTAILLSYLSFVREPLPPAVPPLCLAGTLVLAGVPDPWRAPMLRILGAVAVLGLGFVLVRALWRMARSRS